MQLFRRENYALISALVAIGIIFILDFETPGWAFWLLYAVPVLAASQYAVRKQIIFLGCICSVLTLMGVFFTPSPLPREIAVSNRFLGVGVFWIIAVLMLGRQSLLKNLEVRIEERTADLNVEIAEHSRTEAALQTKMAELEALNKDLESFSYSISHDLRAPLRFVQGYADMIIQDHGDVLNEEALKKFNIIQDSINRMDQLIIGILALSRAERQEIRCEDLNVKSMIAAILNEALQSVDQRRIPEVLINGLSPAKGDPILIRQVFTNLISNAIKFTSKKEQPKIEIGGYISAGESVFYVKDNGAGFDIEDADRLFGLFQRLHKESEFEGTGVGLAIVQRIIKRHGGRVWAEAKMGEGATLFFSLPSECIST